MKQCKNYQLETRKEQVHFCNVSELRNAFKSLDRASFEDATLTISLELCRRHACTVSSTAAATYPVAKTQFVFAGTLSHWNCITQLFSYS